MRHPPSALVAFAAAFVLARVAPANPRIEPGWEPPRRGEIRVIAPPEAVELSRGATVDGTAPDGARSALEDDSGPGAPCGWDAVCGGAGPASAAVTFVSERLEFNLEGTTVRTHAEFEVHSPGGAVPLAFPFAECMPRATLATLTCRGPDASEQAVPVSMGASCWRWTLPDRGPGPYRLALEYRQALHEGRFVYVLTSGASWSDPIDRIWIRVVAPREGSLSFNLPLEPVPISTPSDPPLRAYELSAAHVRPARDFVVTWSRWSEDRGSVGGTVRHEDGTPTAYANVILTGMNIGVIADEQGRFRIAEVPAGAHDLLVRCVSCGPADGRVVVLPDRETTVAVTMHCKPPERR